MPILPNGNVGEGPGPLAGTMVGLSDRTGFGVAEVLAADLWVSDDRRGGR